jgi:hypothetical protein
MRGWIAIERRPQDLERDVCSRVQIERAEHVRHGALTDECIDAESLADDLARAICSIRASA